MFLGPIIQKIQFKFMSQEKFSKQFPQKRVIRFILKSESMNIVKKGGKLHRHLLSTTQHLNRDTHLLVHNLMVPFLFVGASHLLPGEAPLKEVDQHVAYTLEVVPPTLLDPQVRVDGGVPGSTGQVLVLLVGDVVEGLAVPVLLGKPEIDHVDNIGLLIQSHQEILRFDVPVDVVLGVTVFHSGDHLIGDHEHGLQRELALAELEEILEVGAQHVHDHDGVLTDILVDRAPVGPRDAGPVFEALDHLVLDRELVGVLGGLLKIQKRGLHA